MTLVIFLDHTEIHLVKEIFAQIIPNIVVAVLAMKIVSFV
jgi:hypothetical protein